MTIYTDQERLEAIIRHFGLDDARYDVEEAVRDPAEFLRNLLRERDAARAQVSLERNFRGYRMSTLDIT